MSGAGSKNHLTEAPTIHPQATVIDCELGHWTEVGKGTSMRASSMGDWPIFRLTDIRGATFFWPVVWRNLWRMRR